MSYISALIVNYYSEQFLDRLLEQLLQEKQLNEIIIVNNGSDISLDYLKQKSTQIQIIDNNNNSGFARAVNQGVKHCNNDFVLLLNPDLRIMPDMLSNLYQAATTYNAAVCGPRFYWDDEQIFRLPPATGGSLLEQVSGYLTMDYPLEQQLQSFNWELRHDRFWSQTGAFYEPFLSGACLLINRNFFKQQQFIFDPDYFLYYEDADLCAHQLVQGQRLLCVPQASAIHYYNQSPNPEIAKMQLMVNSRHIYLDKHYSRQHIKWLEQFKENSPPDSKTAFASMGVYHFPAQFDVVSDNKEKKHLELALSANFIPFVQAVISGDLFQISENLWQNMPNAHYYTRLRTASGRVLQQWQWSKAE